MTPSMIWLSSAAWPMPARIRAFVAYLEQEMASRVPSRQNVATASRGALLP